jgi:hypothetical protein
MRTFVAILFGLAFVACPLGGVAGEKQITDVKALAGTWQGWETAPWELLSAEWQVEVPVIAQRGGGDSLGRQRQGVSHRHSRRPSVPYRKGGVPTGEVTHRWGGSATGTGWARTPWHAAQRAAWEVLRKAERDG